MVIRCIPYYGISSLIYSIINRIKYKQYYISGITIFIREYNTKIIARTSDFIDACLLDEPLTWRYINKLAKKGLFKTMIDVGAHVGGYAIPLSKIVQNIVAIEPWPVTYKFLKLNKKINNSNNLTLLNIGCSSSQNSNITLCIGLNHSGSTSVYSTNQKLCVKVPSHTLDDVWVKYGPFDMIKIDVEDYELSVLHGLSKRPKFVAIETRLDRISYIKNLLKAQILMIEKVHRSNFFNVIFKL